MITKNDYEKSVLLVGFINEVRNRLCEKNNITDAVFSPLIRGYEVSFVNSGRSISVIIDVKGFFTKKLAIKKYVDGKETATYRVSSKEDFSFYAEQVLS